MARIEISSVSNPYGTGELQLQNKVAMSGTLTAVTDNLNTASSLQLSTSSANFTGNVGIATTPASNIKLHIKGSGTTSSTAPFYVQNGANLGVFAIQDDTQILSYASKFNIRSTGGDYGGWFQTNATQSLQITNNAYNNGTACALNLNGIGVLINSLPTNLGASARLHVLGQGSTSATSSLLVQNSGGTNLLQVRDDGDVYIGTNATTLGCIVTTTNGDKVVMKNNFGSPIIRQVSNDTLVFGGQVITTISASSYVKLDAPMLFGTGQNGAGGSNYNMVISTNAFGSTPSNPTKCMSLSGTCTLQASGYVNAIDLRPNFNFDASGGRIAKGFFYNPTLTNIQPADRHYGIQTTLGGAYINTTTPQDSACLQADSTTQGFLPPRMTDAQIRAIVSPVNGLVAYNTDINHLCCYQAGAWVKFSHTPM